MGRGLRKARPGQKIRRSPIASASQYNLIVDNILWILANKERLERAGSAAGAPQPPRAGIVQVINSESNMSFSQFDVVGLDNILFSNTDNLTEFKNNAAFRAKTPASDTLTKFAVLQEPVSYGTNRVVAAVQDGITIARINVTDATHKYARPTAGERTKFASATSGPVTILWKESGTGSSKWAVICINNGAAVMPQAGYFKSGYSGLMTAIDTGYQWTFNNQLYGTASGTDLEYDSGGPYFNALTSNRNWSMHLQAEVHQGDSGSGAMPAGRQLMVHTWISVNISIPWNAGNWGLEAPNYARVLLNDAYPYGVVGDTISCNHHLVTKYAFLTGRKVAVFSYVTSNMAGAISVSVSGTLNFMEVA